MRVTLGFVGVMGGYCISVFVFGMSHVAAMIAGFVVALVALVIDELR